MIVHHNKTNVYQESYSLAICTLTHWGRVTHICVSKLTTIGSDNGLSPDRRQAIIWTNAGLLLIGPWGINFREILIEILTFSLKKMRLKVSSAKRRPFCLDLNVLTHWDSVTTYGFIDPVQHWTHYLNQQWGNITRNLRNKHCWNLNQITKLFIQ